MKVYRAKQVLERYADGTHSELEFLGIKTQGPVMGEKPEPWVSETWTIHSPFREPEIVTGERLYRALFHFFIMRCPDRDVTDK